MIFAAPQLNQNEGIWADRREARRYSIQLELRWRLIRRRRLLGNGAGSALDFSSGGVMFDAGRPLPAGLDIELSIDWPFLLNEDSPLQLVVSGRIVRCNRNNISLRIVQHEFRTVAAPQNSWRGITAVMEPQVASFTERVPEIVDAFA
jgi:hypothetical protein